MDCYEHCACADGHRDSRQNSPTSVWSPTASQSEETQIGTTHETLATPRSRTQPAYWQGTIERSRLNPQPPGAFVSMEEIEGYFVSSSPESAAPGSESESESRSESTTQSDPISRFSSASGSDTQGSQSSTPNGFLQPPPRESFESAWARELGASVDLRWLEDGADHGISAPPGQ
jgi:hypothetical protein